jgi:formate-dependent nitrite reductase membrane component NrfD
VSAEDYHGLPLLKPPVWTHEVSVYFFLGGLSAGSYMLARLADRFGGDEYRELTRQGTYLAAASILPSAPLLIMDLGDPKRFHHMLRVWKPTSPMNLGSWLLTAYTPVCLWAAFRQAFLANRARGSDWLGIPLALGLAGYTGVLLSTTATPLWSKNAWLGAVFSASAVHCGASGIKLCLELTGVHAGRATLTQVEHLSGIVEAVSVAGYLGEAGDKAAPLLTGEYSKLFVGGGLAAGLLAPMMAEALPAPRKLKPAIKVLGTVVALAGALALRWAITGAGKTSARASRSAK